MPERPDDFENALEADLRALAHQAPPRLKPGELRRALRRRTARRMSSAAGGLACVLMTAWLIWTGPDPVDRRREPIVAQEDAQHTTPEHAPVESVAGVQPLPVLADAHQVQSVLGRLMESAGAERLLVSKRPDEQASFAMVGTVKRSPDELSREINVLFGNFDYADVVMQGGDIQRLSLTSLY